MKKRTLLVSLSVVFLCSIFFVFGHFKNQGRASQHLVSIVVPVYNTEKDLPMCLDSLINQTYTNLEIICVNDGSKDNSLKVLNEYKEKDKRIKVIDKPNGGVSSARNMGIDNATGEFLSFIDSDDYIDNDTYEICVKNLEENKDCELVMFGFAIEPEGHIREIKAGKFDISECHLNLWDYPFTGSACNSVFRKNTIDDNRIRFDTNVVYGEDALFMQMYMMKSNKVLVIDKTFYHYFYYGDEKKYTFDKVLPSRINRGRSLINFCINNKLENRYVWAFDFAVRTMYEQLIRITDENEKRKRFKEVAKIIDRQEITDNMNNFSEETRIKINSIILAKELAEKAETKGIRNVV